MTAVGRCGECAASAARLDKGDAVAAAGGLGALLETVLYPAELEDARLIERSDTLLDNLRGRGAEDVVEDDKAAGRDGGDDR
eukprot:6737009-Prymnesium_polylepis.2